MILLDTNVISEPLRQAPAFEAAGVSVINPWGA